jgi:Arc/MetJ family transcription regulator
LNDPRVEAYVDAIEEHLRARRGVDHILTPRDFGLARHWHQTGVPLATVLVGIDLAFEAAAEPVTSLAYCRRRVEELAACGPRPGRRPAAPPESVSLVEVEAILDSLSERLVALRPGPDACFEPPLRKIEEVRSLVAVAAKPNWDYLRRKLREIDEDVTDAVVRSLDREERAAYEAEARRAVERHRNRMDAEALADAMRRFIVHRARERLKLPRAGLV